MAKKKEVDEKLKKQVVELLMIANGIAPENFDREFKILFVVEGHSAASGLRSKRDSKAHGILALRGKILNVWDRSLSNAMKSDIIKEYLTVLKEERYDRIIVTTDADEDGSSITALVLGCSVRFLNSMVKEGKIFNCESPLYTFKDTKTHKMIAWSNDINDCPQGAKKHANKGLGSYDLDEVTRLILYPQKGAVWSQFVYDKDTNKSLTLALHSGGKEWVKID